MAKRAGWGVALAAVALVIGCSKGQDENNRPTASAKPASAASSGDAAASKTTVTAKTSKEAVMNYFKAVETGDRALWQASAHTDEKTHRMMEAQFDYLIARKTFDEKMVKAYGKDAMKKMGLGLPDDEVPKSTDLETKLKIAETGDKAVATIEGWEGFSMQFVKVGEAWKFDATWRSQAEPILALADDRPEKTESVISELIAVAKRRSEVLVEVSRQVGKTGVSAEMIAAELSKKWLWHNWDAVGPREPDPTPESERPRARTAP